jgi:hypothetical protein
MALLMSGGQVLNSAQMALEPADGLIEADQGGWVWRLTDILPDSGDHLYRKEA